MASKKLPILVVAGVGAGLGTGAATARLFARSGYRVALLARNPEHLKNLADGICADGGEAAPFPVTTYNGETMRSTFEAIKKQWPNDEIRAAVWNAGFGIWKPFLELSEEEVRESVETNVLGPFAFARETIAVFKGLELNDSGKRGTLIFTGATASTRGNTTTSAFAAGKFGMRALSQSLAKEFGKDNIHVAHAIIDGGILTGRAKEYMPAERIADPAATLQPDSIAKSYLFLTGQDQSAFTWELDLRPAHEKW